MSFVGEREHPIDTSVSACDTPVSIGHPSCLEDRVLVLVFARNRWAQLVAVADMVAESKDAGRA